MEFKVYKETNKIAKRLLDFYIDQYSTDRNFYRKAIENSGMVCVAEENGNIIGACRILTDFAKHAHIVDFIVDPAYRGKGIGKELIAFAGKECEKLGCSYIGLTCRPELEKFYEKAGFGPEEGFQYMKYHGSKNSSNESCKIK